MQVTFSVNEYDSDGDVSERGIFIHFGNVRVKVGERVDDLTSVIDQLTSCRKEIVDNDLLT